jgi:hypothetical protein
MNNNNNSGIVPRLDREIERGLRQLDSVIDECIGNQSPFESVTNMSQEYLEDLQDGERHKSKEHYQTMNASQFTLESTDAMTKGDLTDQMQRQEAELEQMHRQETSVGDTQEGLTDSAPYNISAENEDAVNDDVQSPVTIDESDSSRDVMKMDFYIKRGNRRVGPFAGEKIINHYQNGKVDPTDEVSQEAIGPWVAFSDSVFSRWI